MNALSQSELGKLLGSSLTKTGRKTRSPQHPFYLKTLPYVLQPFLCAPVLPGETMTNLSLSSRVVTDPLSNPLIGWWKEYYFFYVKLQDLNIRNDVTTIMLNQEANLNAHTGKQTPEAPHYYGNHHTIGAYNYVEWLHFCMERIVAEHFRDEDCPYDDAVGRYNGMFLAQTPTEHLGQSFQRASYPAATEEDAGLLPGQVLPQYGYDVPPGMEAAHDAWLSMRASGITEATFEDYLRSFGVRVPKQEKVDLHIPEVLRYVRVWQQPSNTVDPASGGVSSACSWQVTERADKDRWFSEPGFVVGVTVARPKVYLQGMVNLGSSFMQTAYEWLPAVLRDDPYTSLRASADGGDGPFEMGQVGTDPYWWDVRDLFMYGEQFTNTPLWGEAGMNLVSLPRNFPDEKKWFPSMDDMNALFKGGAAANKVREDGMVSLKILSALTDQS
jgi:hypothetical protein